MIKIGVQHVYSDKYNSVSHCAQVDRALSAAELSVPPAPPSSVLTPEAFQALCTGPPVQGPSVKQHPRSFHPLTATEPPSPGMLLGIDAEFVAHWPAQKVMQG